MVIKYPLYVTGNLKSGNGNISTALLKQNFNVQDGNWEVCLTSCAMRNHEDFVPKKVVGIRCNLFNSFVEDAQRRKEWNPTVLGLDVVEFPSKNEMKRFSGFCNEYFSFNQAEENMVLDISFIDLKNNSLVNDEITAYLTLTFKKVFTG
jgi:hypothetical protein